MEKVSSQELIVVEDIQDGIIILKSGGLRAVLEAEGINFDLKGPEEQQTIISAFQEFITSLDFPLQIVAHSEKIDITPYLNKIKNKQKEEPNELLKMQMEDYIQFLESFIAEHNIMNKRFFVTVSYQPTVSSKSIFSDIKTMLPFLAEPQTPQQDNKEEFSRNREQLEARISIVSNGLSRIGINNRLLNTEELVQLLYSLYNPQEIY